MRRLKNFSRKHPVTARPSLAPTVPNTARRRAIETGTRERARNSYIRDHEHPAERMHSAGYELITTAPRLRTAVFRGQGNRLGARPMAGSRRDPHRLRRRRNRWRVHQRICLEPVLRARAQNSSMFPPLPTSSGSGCQQGAGTRPEPIDHAAARCDAASGIFPGTRELPTGSCGHCYLPAVRS